MSERDVYNTPDTRVLLRTEDVYQTQANDDVESYSDKLLEIVADFKNSGVPEGANAQSMVGKSKRGEVACQLFAQIDPETGIIEAAGFKTRGCLAMTGCASAACMLIEGKGVEEALEVGLEDIRAYVDDVPAGKVNALHFAACAVQALVGDFLLGQGASLEELAEAVPCDECGLSCIMAEHCSLRQSRAEKREEEEEAERLRLQDNALADVYDLVRKRTATGLLTCATDWHELVPAHLMSHEFTALVLAGTSPPKGDGVKKEATSRFANRGVGIPRAQGDEESTVQAPEATATNSETSSVATTEAAAETASETAPETIGACPREESQASDEEFDLVPPEGYELVCIDGQWGLVPTTEAPRPQHRKPNSADLIAIEGATTTYIYDGSNMRPEFAKWALFAAEDNPLATFIYCVREDSRIYPRPMAQETLTNHPFNMSPDDIEAIWEQAHALTEHADIHRIEASNGDIYYYSTEFLAPEHAQSLAEWSSVGRYMNV